MTCCTHSESGASDRDADRSIIVPSETHPPNNERAPPSTAKLMILPLQPMGTPTRQPYQPYRSDAATDSVAMSGLRQCRTSHTLILQAGREAQLFQGPSPQRE